MEDGARCVCFILAEHVSVGHWGYICCTVLRVYVMKIRICIVDVVGGVVSTDFGDHLRLRYS